MTIDVSQLHFAGPEKVFGTYRAISLIHTHKGEAYDFGEWAVVFDGDSPRRVATCPSQDDADHVAAALSAFAQGPSR